VILNGQIIGYISVQGVIYLTEFCSHYCLLALLFLTLARPVWARGNPPLPLSLHFLTSSPSTLSNSVFYISFLPFLTRFIYFLVFLSLPILPE